MKSGRTHRIPITDQIRQILIIQKNNIDKESSSTRPKSEFVFPYLSKNKSTKKMCKPSRKKELERINDCDQHQSVRPVYKLFDQSGLKGRIVPQGFRSIGRTWMEVNNIKHNVAEMCLAHSVKNASEEAYNRTDYFDERIEALEHWNKFLCSKILSL